MSVELLMNITPPESRIAIVENGMLQEIYIERIHNLGLLGNIYKGKVCRVLPGMQAAFIDIGLERAAFLHATDLLSNGRFNPNSQLESIAEILNEGQEIIVQVVKDPLGSKGARLTTQLSIPSRYLVFMPELTSVGISQKIEEDEERQRLKNIITDYCHDKVGSFIVRTAAEGIEETVLHKEINFLSKLWQELIKKIQLQASCSLIYEDMQLSLRILRDMVGSDIEKVRIDSHTTFHEVIDFANQYCPELAKKIEYYSGERPIFDLYSIEDEIDRALDRKVQLKSGGHLVFDQTEAMTTIDVNTGAFVGHRNLEETIFKTNLEAVQAITRQLKLRNLGGIIIVDFIDMLEEEHKRQVLRSLEKHLAKDHARTHISEVSSLGLVQMTRKRTRESLEHTLCQPCPFCSGRGYMKTPETICYEIFREIIRESRQYEAKKFLVLTSNSVIDVLLDQESDNLARLEQFIGKPIKLQAETLYTQEQYDIVLI